MEKSNKSDKGTQHCQNENLDWPVWRKAVVGAVTGNALALFVVLLLQGSYLWFMAVPLGILIFMALPSRVYKQ